MSMKFFQQVADQGLPKLSGDGSARTDGQISRVARTVNEVEAMFKNVVMQRTPSAANIANFLVHQSEVLKNHGFKNGTLEMKADPKSVSNNTI